MATRTSQGQSTRELLLSAARTILNRDGAAGLSTRTVAAEAGVNLSLIHYYFGSRDGLLLAVLDSVNRDLLARQHRMYERNDLTLAQKWQQAIDFYRKDLRSGYVRSLMEIIAHGYSNPEAAAAARALIDGWRQLLVQAAEEALARLELPGVEATEVASAIVSFWYGMEMQHMLSTPEEEARLWQTLDAIGGLIAKLENEHEGAAT